MKSKITIKIALLIGLLTMLAGCSSAPGAWIVGKWKLDREYTQKQLPEELREAGMFGMSAANQLLDQLDGMTVEFTDTELRVQMGNGTGEVKGYEVLEAPDANTVVLKSKDGKIQTYFKEGDYIATSTEGGVVFNFYFKRM